MQRSKWYRLMALSIVFAAGCASGPQVRIDKDPTADLTQYKTFAFYDQVATDRSKYSTIMTARLKQATAAELRRLGYTYDEANPELRVNFFLNVMDKQAISSTPSSGFYGYRRYAAWAGYPYAVETEEYKAGTLSIDLVDARRNLLVWQGIAEGKIKRDAMKNPGPAVDAVVAGIFSNFPDAPKS